MSYLTIIFFGIFMLTVVGYLLSALYQIPNLSVVLPLLRIVGTIAAIVAMICGYWDLSQRAKS